MKPIDVRSPDDAAALVREREVKHIHVGLTDISGQLRGKYISAEGFLEALHKGLPLTHNCAAADFCDQILPVDGLTRGDVRFGDGHVRIVPESCRVIPWEQPHRNLFFLLEYDDKGAAFDARALLARVLARGRDMGFRAFYSCELEFRLFEETSLSLRQKHYQGLAPFLPFSNYLGVMSQSACAEFFDDLTTVAEALDVPIDAAHWELGTGFGELALRYCEGMRAADNAVIYKSFAKSFAMRRKLTLSFMARFDETVDGSSCHIHASLRDIDGAPVFHDPREPHSISRTLRHFIGGAQRLLPELLLMLAPNVNSFKRLQPGFFAPTAATWGMDNRTVALRVIEGGPNSQRLEHRVAGSDANPYLATACVLASGLWGIEHAIEPTAPVGGNAWDAADSLPAELRLPSTFDEAIVRFEHSDVAKALFGAEFVRVFAAGRAAQGAQFRSAVTDWERKRFLELA